MVRKTRTLSVAVALVVASAAAVGTWALTRSPANAATATNLVAATTSDVSQTVATTGTIQPKQRADLSFTVSGTVTTVAATVGQKVSKGAVLATVDTTTLTSAVNTATAAVTAAEQQVADVSGGTATQVTSAQAQLAQAQSQLATAQNNLAAASLTAPFSGVVAAVGISVGDTAGSSGSSGSGGTGSGTATSGGGGGAAGGSTTTSTSTSSVITVISTSAWVVNASVGSADLAQLKKGLQAQITPTGSRTPVFGTVTSLGILASSSTTGSATFPVVIDVTGNPTGMYAGASANVTIIVKKVTGVLTVPTAAVLTESGKTVVHQMVGGKQVSTPVTIGTVYGALTEIKTGLKVGDQVVVALTRFGGGGAGRTGGAGGGGQTGGGGGGGGGFGGGGFGGGAAGGAG